jgi:hypothetical protein
MATLDYYSVDNWIKLTVVVVRWWEQNKQDYDLTKEADCLKVLAVVGTTAADMGFTIAMGNRWRGAESVLHHLDPRLSQYVWTADGQGIRPELTPTKRKRRTV